MITYYGLSGHQALELIQPGWRVLELGGAVNPLLRADIQVDIQLPNNPQDKCGYLLRDVNEGLPFTDKSFDFVWCSHLLEDIRDPIRVCSEIVRVGKAGYIAVPSREIESCFGIDDPKFCGFVHHRWLCELIEDVLVFTFKSPYLLIVAEIYSISSDNLTFVWRDNFEFRENFLLTKEEMKEDVWDFTFNRRFKNKKGVVKLL